MRSAGPRTALQSQADRRAEEGVRRLGTEMRHLREDAGLSKTVVAGLAGIDPTHLALIEAGRRDASAVVRERIAAALGTESSTRLFPAGGPRVRDRFQVRILEAFLRDLPGHWRPFVEVAVNRPARGVIDAVLADQTARRLVTVEAHSELRRVEQQVRWAFSKSESLQSATGWPFMPDGPEPSVWSILLLRSTRATRELARAFEATLAAAYPAPPAAVRRALADPAASWPGSGIVWVGLDGIRATLLPGWPRGVRPEPGRPARPPVTPTA
jgi:transcriptional regulator with XRE-family HTH domain